MICSNCGTHIYGTDGIPTVAHMQGEHAALTAENARLRADLDVLQNDHQGRAEHVMRMQAVIDAMRLDLARLTEERDALLAAAKAAYTVQPGWLDILRLAVAEVEKPDAVPVATPTEETKPEPGRKR